MTIAPPQPWQEQAWQEWLRAIASDRMHHAWLLAGKDGLGKAEFALAAARELVAIEGVRQAAETHPDILHLTHEPKDKKEADKKAEGKPYQVRRNIAVDQIRRMQSRLSTRPTLGAYRAVVINPADDMEKGAANALLKSLEEPPQGTFFLLVAHRPGRLLPTIRSRCRLLAFAPLTGETLDREIARLSPETSEQARRAAAAAAGGSPGRALEFIDMDLGKYHLLMRQLVSQGDPRLDLRARLVAAAGPRPSRELQLALIELARGVLAETIRTADKGALPSIADAHDRLSRLGGQAPTYNFDPAILLHEIGNLLAGAAPIRETANG